MAETQAKIDALKKKMVRAEQVGKQLSDFEEDLVGLVNRHSLENLCGTPDFIIAGHLANQVMVLAGTVNDREKWYGREQDQFGMPTGNISLKEDPKPYGPHSFTVRRQDGIGPHADTLPCKICGVTKGEHE